MRNDTHDKVMNEQIAVQHELAKIGEQLDLLLGRAYKSIEDQVMLQALMDPAAREASAHLLRKTDPYRWVHLSRDALQQGVMFLQRAMEQPDRF